MQTMVSRSLPLSWPLLLVLTLAAGCSKQQPAAGANAGTNAAQAEASGVAPVASPPTRGPGPMQPPAKPTVIADSGDANATLNQLSLELRRYVVGTRSVPKNYEEFAAKSHVQAPPPPAGKKYAIRDQAVVLVKR